MKKEKNPKNKRPQRSGNNMLTQVQASVEIQSLVSISYRCDEKEYEHLFIRKPEVRAHEGKMTHTYPEYHERIMRITRVTGHDSLSLLTYIGRVLMWYFNQHEEVVKNLYIRNYNPVSQPFKKR